MERLRDWEWVSKIVMAKSANVETAAGWGLTHIQQRQQCSERPTPEWCRMKRSRKADAEWIESLKR